MKLRVSTKKEDFNDEFEAFNALDFSHLLRGSIVSYRKTFSACHFKANGFVLERMTSYREQNPSLNEYDYSRARKRAVSAAISLGFHFIEDKLKLSIFIKENMYIDSSEGYVSCNLDEVNTDSLWTALDSRYQMGQMMLSPADS